MPIRINLLAEAQAAEELRRKDPVKRSIWYASFAVGLVLCWSLSLQFKVASDRRELKNLEGKWSGLEAAYNKVEGNRQKYLALRQKHSALDQFTTNRFLWAGTLNALQHSVVDNVQLLRLKAEQTYVISEGARSRTNGATVLPGKSSTSTERISILLDAKDYSARAAEQVASFKEALASQPYFQSNLIKTNGVRLTNLSAPQVAAITPRILSRLSLGSLFMQSALLFLVNKLQAKHHMGVAL